MQWRTVVLVGTVSLALGWAMGGGMASQPSGNQAGSSGRGPRPLGVEQTNTAPLTRQLRLKLDQQPARPQPSRNPFVFGARAPAAAPAGRPASAPDPVDPNDDVPPPPPGPTFTLSGMASSAGPDGPIFTAIINTGQGLLFVKAGDELPGGYVVADLQETMVTLRDSSGGERTLRLR